MKNQSIFRNVLLTVFVVITLLLTACSTPEKEKTNQVEANIKIYTHTWDQIINEGKLELMPAGGK